MPLLAKMRSKGERLQENVIDDLMPGWGTERDPTTCMDPV